MKTCKGLKAFRSTSQAVLIIALMMGGSLRELQLASAASHLHSAANYADLTTARVEPSSQPTTTEVDTTPAATVSTPTNTSSSKRYKSITADCKAKNMTVVGQFGDVFKGRIYALGYPDEPECGTTAGTGSGASENVTFSIPLGQCGVQMTAGENELEGSRTHDVTLYIQYSAFLQQVVDEKISLSCMEQKLKPEDVEPTISEESSRRKSRQGRRMKDSAAKSDLPKIPTKVGEAWMEILSGKDPTPKSKKHSPVSVGQDVTLVVSTKISRGYDARVINCTAHDGSRTGTDGFRTQQLLDSAGCSVDRGLVPNFRRRRLPIENSRLSTLHFATFPAFKFPERDHLHIKCMVAYCQGPCPQEACDSGRNHFGSWREKYGRIAEVLVDTSDVVNSLEILAPELESNAGGHHYERHQSVHPSAEPTGATNGNSNNNNNNNNNNGGGTFNNAGSSRQFSDSQQLFYTSNNGQQQGQQQPWPNAQIPQSSGPNVCISPGTVILALVILGVVLVISATATLWFALKRSELKKLQMKHGPYQHGPNPYYRFSQHW